MAFPRVQAQMPSQSANATFTKSPNDDSTSQPKNENNSSLQLSQQDYKHLISLLQSLKTTNSTSANTVSNTHSNDAPTKHVISHVTQSGPPFIEDDWKS